MSLTVPARPEKSEHWRSRQSFAAPATKFVPAGVVEVAAHGEGWFLVSIGRGKSVKRFNITRGEAAELVRVLTERVLTQDRPDGAG